MNKLIIAGLLIINCFIFGVTDSIKISVEVKGFKSNSGKARVLVFKSDDGFPSEQSNAVLSFMSDIKDLTAIFDIKLIPGEYAFSIHHDENNKGGIHENEFRIKTKDGRVVWIEHSCKKIFDEEQAKEKKILDIAKATSIL